MSSGCVIHFVPYLEKGAVPENQPLATPIIKNIATPMHGIIYNVTLETDQLLLVDKLLKSPSNLPIVGTTRSTKHEIS